MKNKVLVIVGPTASGKSDLAVKLAQKLKGEVVSADSRQVYKGLDVGSGKITKKEMLGVPHHMLDVVSLNKVFTASDYKSLATKKIREISTHGALPIVVGGTGFYIDSLRMDLPEVPPNKKLRKELEKKSVEELSKLLGPHEVRDKQNKVRLIRAIEIVEALGHIPKIKESNEFDFVFIGLNPKDLDKKIEERLKKRLPKIITEVKKLRKNGTTWKRFYELGLEYRYVSLFVRDLLSKDEMYTKLLKEIKNYAKRQRLWFKKNKQIKWFSSASLVSLATIRRLLAN